MAYLVSALAFAMAFGAIWFTSEAARRTELRGKALVKPHMKLVEESLSKSDAQMRDLERRVASAEKEIKILKAERDQSRRQERVEEADMPDSLMPPKAMFRPTAAYNA